MGAKRLKLSPKHALPYATDNKFRRQDLYVKRKKLKGHERHKLRSERRKEETQNPSLKEERLRKNVPASIDRKRTWDQVDPDNEDLLGVSVDTEQLRHVQLDEEATMNEPIEGAESDVDEQTSGADELDSMLDSDSEEEEDRSRTRSTRATSPVHSTTSTNLTSTPEELARRFPSLFDMTNDQPPKILITTSFNSTLHKEAALLTDLFPNSVYIPRSAHRYSHKYSIREISAFASNRNYTAVLILNEDQKKPCGLDLVHLPKGPMFHFSLVNWIEGKKLPGHGRATDHYPELLLNNFRTPLGLLTAHMFRTMFPPKPEFQGRQVVTLHNQRDYIFVRRHRYVFREKRESEKNVVGSDGRDMAGVEGLRTGLQELGPRFTLKLRRIDKGIQRSSGQEWEWRGKMNRVRTKFQL